MNLFNVMLNPGVSVCFLGFSTISFPPNVFFLSSSFKDSLKFFYLLTFVLLIAQKSFLISFSLDLNLTIQV